MEMGKWDGKIRKFLTLKVLKFSKFCEVFEYKINTIKENAFKSLNNLTELYLNKNQIAEIKENTFSGLSSLTHLYLIKYISITCMSNIIRVCWAHNIDYVCMHT